MRLPGGVAPSLLATSPHSGHLIAHSVDLSLHSFTLNGRLQQSADCTERFSAMAVSPDGRFILTGGMKGIITLMWLHSFQVLLPRLSVSYATDKSAFMLQGLHSESPFLADYAFTKPVKIQLVLSESFQWSYSLHYLSIDPTDTLADKQ